MRRIARCLIALAQLVACAASPARAETASGDIDFGITGLTAGLYALASQHRASFDYAFASRRLRSG